MTSLCIAGSRAACVLQAMQSAEQHSERTSGGLLGGYKEVSTSDSEVTEAASFAAEQLSQRSNSLFPFKVKEVTWLLSPCIPNRALCPTSLLRICGVPHGAPGGQMYNPLPFHRCHAAA